jgi:hypothetical protein
MKYVKLFIAIALFVLNTNAFSQNREEQLVFFSSNLGTPIKVDVQKSDRGLTFSAYNKSLFPYTVQLEFNNLQNLTPTISNVKRVVNSGYANLVQFSFLDKNSSHNYAYSTTYFRGDLSQKPDTGFNYPVPLAEGKEIKLLSVKNSSGRFFFNNVFKSNTGDTIFAMRKGVVTSTPESGDNFERIIRKGSIEILHQDGTVAIYQLPEFAVALVQPVQKIYPLQPIAIIKSGGNLVVQLVQLNDSGKLKQLKIHFDNPGMINDNPDNTIVKHSPEAAEAELSKSEKKKLQKGTLYK